MNHRTVSSTLIATSLIASNLIGGIAHATLLGRDLNGSVGSFEAYYDTDLDITWLANANANANGLMAWFVANTWAANLSLADGVNVYDNWRLPTTLQPDASCGSQSGGASFGFNCTGSEMGHLLYSELGGTAGQSILSSADPDLAKFTNFQVGGGYWSTASSALGTGGAWHFFFSDGSQNASGRDAGYALAVSPGDVGTANNNNDNNTVPEPQTLALLGLGLAGIAFARRRKA